MYLALHLENLTGNALLCPQVIQRRTYGSVDFTRNWTQYAAGFGSINGEHWLGNDLISLLTKGRNQQLLVKVRKYTLEATAKYGYFQVQDSSSNYQLNVAGFLGGSAGLVQVLHFQGHVWGVTWGVTFEVTSRPLLGHFRGHLQVISKSLPGHFRGHSRCHIGGYF